MSMTVESGASATALVALQQEQAQNRMAEDAARQQAPAGEGSSESAADSHSPSNPANFGPAAFIVKDGGTPTWLSALGLSATEASLVTAPLKSGGNGFNPVPYVLGAVALGGVLIARALSSDDNPSQVSLKVKPEPHPANGQVQLDMDTHVQEGEGNDPPARPYYPGDYGPKGPTEPKPEGPMPDISSISAKQLDMDTYVQEGNDPPARPYYPGDYGPTGPTEPKPEGPMPDIAAATQLDMDTRVQEGTDTEDREMEEKFKKYFDEQETPAETE